MSNIQQLHDLLVQSADPQKAKLLERFFKTGKGEYAEGDKFLGLTVPQSRKIVAQFRSLPLTDISKLLQSKWHEERLIALLLLVHKFEVADQPTQTEIFNFYIQHTRYINNWDLVDLSAPKIVGSYLLNNPKEKDLLKKLAKSPILWERRIAVLATFQFINAKKSADALEIAEMLLSDKHDLIHKAVGWMLREVGKRISQEEEELFLKKHAAIMPRTMLRYAIERFPETKRKLYLTYTSSSRRFLDKSV